MPYYRIDTNIATKGLAPLRGRGKNVVSLGLGTGGEFLLETKKKLDNVEGLIALTEEEREALRPSTGRVGGVEQRVLPGMACLEDARQWSLESYSPRRAQIRQSVSSAGVLALRVVLGAGRGDRVYLGRVLSIPAEAQTICIKVQARCEETEPLAMGLVLTTARERPWLELPARQLHPGKWEELNFDLNELDRNKREKVSRLLLAVISDLDEGQVMIERIKVCA